MIKRHLLTFPPQNLKQTKASQSKQHCKNCLIGTEQKLHLGLASIMQPFCMCAGVLVHEDASTGCTCV